MIINNTIKFKLLFKNEDKLFKLPIIKKMK